jgi:hypothetical protein
LVTNFFAYSPFKIAYEDTNIAISYYCSYPQHTITIGCSNVGRRHLISYKLSNSTHILSNTSTYDRTTYAVTYEESFTSDR